MDFAEDLLVAVASVVMVFATAMIDVSDPAIVTIGGTILAGLTGTVKVLWDKNNKLQAATELALSKCETEHQTAAARMDNLVKQVISLSEEVGVLKGRIQGYQEAQNDLEKNREHG